MKHAAAPRSVAELVFIAVTEPDEDIAWEAITTLHERGTREVFEAARDLTQSKVLKERIVGVDILAQIGVPERAFPDETFDILAGMLEAERNAELLGAIGTAFGHLGDPRATPLLMRLAGHASDLVRFGAVMGLLGLREHNDQAVAALIALSEDEDAEVRNWATFGLGTQIEADSPAIRAALLARLEDADEEIRLEALAGLAARRDARALDALVEALAGGAIDPALPLHADLCAALTALKDEWSGDPARLAAALAACRSDGAE
ncbi:MAG: hypothetical protein Kow00124_24970 [Anaerolineae bacterium]